MVEYIATNQQILSYSPRVGKILEIGLRVMKLFRQIGSELRGRVTRQGISILGDRVPRFGERVVIIREMWT